MSLHADLLDQAEMLAKFDRNRPKQANLRRAVSAAYYALFHLLTSEVAALYAVESRRAALIIRTLNHGDMKKVSVMFGSSKLPKALQGGNYETPPDLKIVADAFVNLQQARNEADYDLSRSFSRHEAFTYVRTSRRAFDCWSRVRKTDDARLYLACFHLWKAWDQGPR